MAEWLKSTRTTGGEYAIFPRKLRPVWVTKREGGWMVDRGGKSTILAGPFPTKEAAKLAAEMMYG